MTSKYKIKKNKTRKIFKGGGPVPDFTELVKIATCFINPLCGITKLFEILHSEIKFCIEMVNNIFLESGLYLTNIYKYGGESSLEGIIDKVCFDIFDEKICKTKINELLYIKQLPDDIINKIMSTKETHHLEQKGGTTNSINALIIKNNNISIDTFFSDNKDYVQKYILDQFRPIKSKDLYTILKYIKLMNHLYDKDVKNEKINKSDPIPIFKNEIGIGSNSFNTWNLCSKYHQGENVKKDIYKYFGENASEKQICNINGMTMYEQTLLSSTNINYEPVFTKCFFDIAKILKDYYTIKNIDDEAVNIKIIEYDLENELKEVYKLIKLFSIYELLFNLLKYKVELEHKVENVDEFIKSFGNQ